MAGCRVLALALALVPYLVSGERSLVEAIEDKEVRCFYGGNHHCTLDSFLTLTGRIVADCVHGEGGSVNKVHRVEVNDMDVEVICNGTYGDGGHSPEANDDCENCVKAVSVVVDGSNLCQLESASCCKKWEPEKTTTQEAIGCEAGVKLLLTSHGQLRLQDNHGNLKMHKHFFSHEQWVITEVEGGKYAIKSWAGRRLQDNDGVLSLTKDDLGDMTVHQHWKLTDAGDLKVFISSHRGQFLQDNDGPKLTPNADNWAKWSISTLDWQPACSVHRLAPQ